MRSLDPKTYGPHNIGRMLGDLHVVESDLQPYISVRRGAYTRNLVFANADFEMMVLVWDRGAKTPIHDHAMQQCWFTVVSGAFDVENYRRVSGGYNPGRAVIESIGMERDVQRGQPDYRFGDEDIHRVTVAERCERSISLHIYAKPLSSCLIYDTNRGQCTTRYMAYDTVARERLAVANF